MILEYHRPDTLEAALALLARETPPTYPMGGGTVLSRHAADGSAVVDLQNLPLNGIERRGNQLILGATATLQAVVEAQEVPQPIREAARQEASLNTRQAATVAGALVCGDGASPLLALLLAQDALLSWQPGEREVSLGNWLPLRHERMGLLVQISVSLQVEAKLATVGRSPADRAQVLAAVGRWPSGRVRIVAGGGELAAPLVVLDGTEAGGYREVTQIAYSHQPNLKNSTAYLQETTVTLIERLIGEAQ